MSENTPSSNISLLIAECAVFHVGVAASLYQTYQHALAHQNTEWALDLADRITRYRQYIVDEEDIENTL